MTLRIGWMALALSISTMAAAEGFETFNQSSFARAHALPTLGLGAVLPRGESINSVGLDWTNESADSVRNGEALTLDAEAKRMAMRYRVGVAPLFGQVAELSVEVPILFNGGGVLDGPIETWHDVFGLPNGNRDDRPKGRYAIRYTRGNTVLVDLDKGDAGLADVRVGAGLGLTERLTLRGMLQLPTGNDDELTGGHFGGASWLDYSLPLNESRRAALLFSVGASAATTHGPLGRYQRPVVAVGGAVLIVPIYKALDGIVQVEANGKLYKRSNIDALDKVGAPLTVGFRLPYKRLVFDAAVIEDPSVNASPDFGFLFAIKVKDY